MRALIILPLLILLAGCSTLLSEQEGQETDCSPHSTPLCIQITGPRMTPTDFEAMLMRHEGYRRHPYTDSNTTSIGYGRNLLTNGVSESEALELLRNDVTRIASELASKHPVVNELGDVRYYVLVSMAYTMGVEKLGTFELLWLAIDQRDYKRAALEMYLSKWCGDVKNRCSELAEMMETNEYNPPKG